MQAKPVASESRVPTSQWSGAGLSVSTPDYVLRKLKQSSEEQMVILLFKIVYYQTNILQNNIL